MILDLLILLAGLVLIVQGGDLFVSSSVRIAEFLRMPRIIIGSTLVSLATTTPELTVSIMSGLHGESGLAVGNALGSCICNFGLILGVMATLKHVETHPSVLRVPFLAVLGCGVLLLLMTWNLRLARVQGVVLILLGIGYFVYDFRRHYRFVRPLEIREAQAIGTEITEGHRLLRSGWGTTILFAVGAVLVVGGSKLLVDAAVDLASRLGIPPMVVGLTAIAVGTSLPELVTAITSTRRNVSDLAVGNILGANIANLTFIVGSAATVHEVTMSRSIQLLNLPALLIGIGLTYWMITTEKRVTRFEGLVLLVYYGLFLVLLTGLMLSGWA